MGMSQSRSLRRTTTPTADTVNLTLPQPQTGHDPHETVLFEDKQYDFRIPATVYIREWQTFLAFAEKREPDKTGISRDEDAKNLVMRRGTRQPTGTLQWSATKDLKKAIKDGYRTMSPCPVFETSTKTLFLFFICIKDRIKEKDLQPGQTCLCYITTKDSGKTWSKLKDVTKNIHGVDLSRYKTFAVGPGHGIEAEGDHSGSLSTENMTGKRLLIPAYVVSESKKNHIERHALVLYSDDAGRTWQAGKQLSRESGECQVAEVRVADGTEFYLYCSARTYGSGGGCTPRLETLSDNTGESFTKLQSLSLKDTPHGCQGSVLGFPAPDKSTSNTWLLFSHPTRGPNSGENQWMRRDLGVHLRRSLQDGGHRDQEPWGEPYVIHPGKSGYSDLTLCDEEERFGCLMECGESERLRVVFKELSLSAIIL